MNLFLDSSVVLRALLREPNPFSPPNSHGTTFVSQLLAIEVARVLDRLRLDGALSDDDIAATHEQARLLYQSFDELALTNEILTRAASAFPTVVGTLDAIHLASALSCAAATQQELLFVTHDRQLGRAARACGFPVTGNALR